jgi:hypothetical protein
VGFDTASEVGLLAKTAGASIGHMPTRTNTRQMIKPKSKLTRASICFIGSPGRNRNQKEKTCNLGLHVWPDEWPVLFGIFADLISRADNREALRPYR